MNAQRAIVWMLAAAFSSCTLAACRRAGEPHARASATAHYAPAPALLAHTLPPRLDDAQLAARVKAALATQVGIDAFRIKVRARRGTVTLEGQAPNAAVANSELDTAREIPGVERLVNRVRVAP